MTARSLATRWSTSIVRWVDHGPKGILRGFQGFQETPFDSRTISIITSLSRCRNMQPLCLHKHTDNCSRKWRHAKAMSSPLLFVVLIAISLRTLRLAGDQIRPRVSTAKGMKIPQHQALPLHNEHPSPPHPAMPQHQPTQPTDLRESCKRLCTVASPINHYSYSSWSS